MQKILLSALAMGCLIAPTAFGQDCSGTDGFRLDIPEEIPIGTEFKVSMEAPFDAFSLLFLNFELGRTPTRFGDLCFDFPAATMFRMQLPDGYASFLCDVDCNSQLIGLKTYWQFVAFNSQNFQEAGISNSQMGCLIAGDCLNEEFCPSAAEQDDSVAPYGGGHAMWVPGMATDYVFDPDADSAFTEYPDGTAVLSGMLYSESNPCDRWSAEVILDNLVLPGDADYPPEGSPKKELFDDAYSENGGPIDTDTWHYYLTVEGILLGEGCNDGKSFCVTRRGPAFQIGYGASGKNTNFGGSCWFDGVLKDGDGRCDFTGDFNLDFGDCPDDN